jgi:hypothetical protein
MTTSVKKASKPVEIQTGYLLKRSVDHCHYASLFGLFPKENTSLGLLMCVCFLALIPMTISSV